MGELIISRFNSKPKSKIEKFKYGIKNFKSFKDFQYIEIKPLTVICGINNCGKSSLIQSILLLSQSLTSLDRTSSIRTPFMLPFKFLRVYPADIEEMKYETSLLFEGKFSHLSDFNNIINKYTDINEFSFGYDYHDKHFTFTFFNPVKENALESYVKNIELIGDGYNLQISANLDEDNKIINYSCYINEMNLYTLFNFSFEIEILLRRIKKKDMEKFKDFYIRDYEVKNIQILFQSFIPFTLYLPRKNFLSEVKTILKKFEKDSDIITDILKKIKKEFEKEEYGENVLHFLGFHSEFFYFLDFFSSIHYIGPLRDEPHRYYQFFDIRKIDIGNKGENTPQILALENDSKIPSFKIFNIEKKQLNFKGYRNITLKEGLSKWLQKLDLPEVSPKRVEQILVKIMVNLQKLDDSVTLQDVGFGISQILPVYIESLRMDKDHTLILEQPEIHLHPNMQAKLADFLLSMTVSGKRYIIETHSEHLINRLCLRIAQDQTNKIKDLISIVFIEPPKEDKEKGLQGSIIKELKLNKYGEIENWPIGFFDETDHPHILKAGIDKKKREKEGN